MANSLILAISTAVCLILILSGIGVFPNTPNAFGQDGAHNSLDFSVKFANKDANGTSEEPDLSTPKIEPDIGDGSICADYESGETPPAHLNCDVETIETGEKNTIISDKEGFVISLPPGVTPEQHALWWKDVQECYIERTGVEAPEVVIGSNEEVQAHFDLLEECGVKDMKEYGDEVTIVDRIRSANETVVEDDTGGQQLEGVDNMPQTIGRAPDVRGPAVEECSRYVDDALVMLIDLDEKSGSDYFDFIGRNAGSVYCRDTPGWRSGDNGIAYVNPYFPNTIQLNPSLIDMIPERPPECETGTEVWVPVGDTGAAVLVKCDMLWEEYDDEIKFLASVLVHEAVHTDQLDFGKNQEDFYQGSTERYGPKRAEWEAYQEQAKSFMLLQFTWRGLEYTTPVYTPEEYYEWFLLYRYEWLFDRPMPAIEYERIFGEEPPVSTTSLTEDIPAEIEEELEESKVDDGHFLGNNNQTSIVNNSDPIHQLIPQNNINETEYTIISEVRDSNGITIYLNLLRLYSEPKEDGAEDIFWRPEKAGDYEIRNFAISGLDNPRILSPPMTFNFKISQSNNQCEAYLLQEEILMMTYDITFITRIPQECTAIHEVIPNEDLSEEIGKELYLE